MKKMRLTPAILLDAAVLVKANLSGWYILLALLFLSVFMSGCDTKQEEAENFSVLQNCTIEVTAEGYTCALTAFDGVMLKADDGTYLHPWVNATTVQQLTDGQRYRVGFVEIEKDNRYDGIAQCRAYVPVGRIVKITCLQPVENTVN